MSAFRRFLFIHHCEICRNASHRETHFCRQIAKNVFFADKLFCFDFFCSIFLDLPIVRRDTNEGKQRIKGRELH
jgi:hypothetical protein